MKPSEGEGEHDTCSRIDRSNSRGVERTFLGTLQCRGHFKEGSIVLPPLKFRLQMLLFALCPSEARRDRGTVAPSQNRSHNPLHKNGVKVFANVHVGLGLARV